MKIQHLLLLSLCVSRVYCAPLEITYNRDVLPVLQQRCQECHRPGEAAPMSFMTYKETRPWAAAIREAVTTRTMPPWHADPAHGKFSNDRRLTDEELNVLSGWANTGAKEGNAKDAPPPREFSYGWKIGKPDLILDMGADYRVPAKGTVEYVYFVVPTGFTEDKWVEQIEIRPSARSVVHHVVLMTRGPKGKWYREAKSGTPFVPPATPPPQERPVDKGEGTFLALGVAGSESGREIIGTYVPGATSSATRPGQARLIRAGSDLVFQIHYTATGTATVDHTQVGFVFAQKPPKERVINTFIMNDKFRIPAGNADFAVSARATIHSDVKLQSFSPHMHLRGKAMEYRVVYPNGESQVLLDVPKYDFNWQTTYHLEEPLLLPAETRIEVTARFDNSSNNRFNPDPGAEVFWGDQSWEEMLAGFIDFVIPASMDPMDIIRAQPVQQPR